MVGGLSSAVHLLTVETPDGRRSHLVLRRVLHHEGHGDPSRRVGREMHTLTELSRTDGVPSPQLVAVDRTGEQAGGQPALLMTRLPGHVHLRPATPDAWLGQMAAVLPRIHAADIEAPPYEPWFDGADLVVPEWTSRPAAWRAAIDIVCAGLPSTEPVFLHRDYQHFNMLWSRGRLTGVIDWMEASQGPPDVDVAHCRLNLAVLFSSDWAERFRLAYEAEAGRTSDPRFDLASLVGYGPDWKQFIPLQVGHRAALDIASMDARVEDLLLSVLARC
jgi:aminoglycoside phosphotransferase (APT) family kinase protein